MIAAPIGTLAGAFMMWCMYRSGMLAVRSGLAVLLAAIASFYPVFAVQSGDQADIILHLVIFTAFILLAVAGFRRGAYLIAGGLIAHGVFDIGLMVLGAPGPVWWPAFCAAVDIAAGTVLIRLQQTRKVPL
ncbi:MAG: hypothetical protein P8Q57_05530 [Yoonia sp.]|nr:hypothetical protein [Yoonia sp.]